MTDTPPRPALDGRLGRPAVAVAVTGVILLLGVAGALVLSGAGGDSSPTGADNLSGDGTQADDSGGTDSRDDAGDANGTGDGPALTTTVTGVVDGHTLAVGSNDSDGTATLRLLGVDTPAVDAPASPREFEGVPGTQAARDCLRDVGSSAVSYLRDRVLGETVAVRIDPEAGRFGPSGQLLGLVSEGETSLNHDLVERGYGRVTDSTFSGRERFDEAETAAQSDERGVWSCRSARSGDGETARVLAVSTIFEDAIGNDSENPDTEFVVFESVADEPLDLTGWTVTDEDANSYQFPAGFVLEPGETVRLFSGHGPDSGTDLHWGRDAPVWDNDGDTVTVLNASGAVVLEEPY